MNTSRRVLGNDVSMDGDAGALAPWVLNFLLMGAEQISLFLLPIQKSKNYCMSAPERVRPPQSPSPPGTPAYKMQFDTLPPCVGQVVVGRNLRIDQR